MSEILENNTVDKPNLDKVRKNLVIITLVSVLTGFGIPGFTAMALLLIQMGLSSLGVECAMAWNVIFTVTILTSLVLPVVFFIHLGRLKLNRFKSYQLWLICFNFLEYLCIQAALASLLTNGKILCYANGGQNGLELIFTGWLAALFLIPFGLIAFQALKKTVRRILRTGK